MEEQEIKLIKMSNIGCIETLQIKPDIITTISGENGVGKSSVIKALQSLIEPGGCPDLLRDGAEEGRVELYLKSGIAIIEIITKDRTRRDVKHPEFGVLPRPAEFIGKIISRIAFDPAGFLTAKPEKRVEIFLKSLPKTITAEQVSFLPPNLVALVDLSQHALKTIGDDKSGLYGLLYSKRKEVNAVIADKKGMIGELERTLPQAPAPDATWQGRLQEMRDQLAVLEDNTTVAATAINNDADAAYEAKKDICTHVTKDLENGLVAMIDKLKEEARAKIREIETQRDAEIERWRADTANAVKTAEAARDQSIGEINNQCEAALGELKKGYRPEHDRLTGDIAKAETMLEQDANSKAARELVGKVKGELANKQMEADAISLQMEKLLGLKTSLLSELPIKGMELIEGRLFYNGEPFDRINDSKKHDIAVEIMCLNKGQLGLMVLDRAEIFDARHWKLFQEACIRRGVPIFAARVTNQPGLHVETKGKEQ